MSDNLKRKGPRDASRINVSEAHELAYWSKKLSVSKEKLVAAVKAVGAMVEDVKRHLKKGVASKKIKKLGVKNISLLSVDVLADMLANDGLFVNACIKEGNRFEIYQLNGSLVVLVGKSMEKYLDGCNGVTPKFLERMLKRKMGIPVW